jgi:large subunit ribosomal protein L29
MASGLTAQLRVSTEEELHTKLAQAKEELFNLRFQGATGQLESHGRLHAVRKEIARIYTVMRERELGIITLVEESDEPEAVEPETPAAPALDNAAVDDAGTDDTGTDDTGTDDAAEDTEAEEADE